MCRYNVGILATGKARTVWELGPGDRYQTTRSSMGWWEGPAGQLPTEETTELPAVKEGVRAAATSVTLAARDVQFAAEVNQI